MNPTLPKPVDQQLDTQLGLIATLPKFWFWVALCALAPVQIWFVASDPWFSRPPKPIGDGPDYENIAFHLSQGYGWSMDWTNPKWRTPYLNSSVSDAASTSFPLTDDKLRRLPIADYTIQLNRTDTRSATTGRPPLFPTLVAVVYWLLPRGSISFAAVRLLLALCLAIAGSLAVAITVRIARQLTRHVVLIALAAMVTMALAAMDRTMRTYATDFLTEPIALLFVQLMLWCLCKYAMPEANTSAKSEDEFGDRDSWWSPSNRLLIATGILLGLLTLTRSIIVLWLPGVWVIVLLACRLQNRQAPSTDEFSRLGISKLLADVRKATTVIGIAMAVCAPWWFRNCLVLGAFMPLGTQGPITLLGGYNDEALERKGEWYVGPEMQLRWQLGQRPGESIIEREKRVARAASSEVSKWISAHWGRLLILSWVRIKTEWNPYTGRVLAVKLAALIGLCWLLILHRSAVLLLGGLLLVNTLTVMVLYSVGGRFLIPTFGIVYSLAGIGVACTCGWRRLAAVV